MVCLRFHFGRLCAGPPGLLTGFESAPNPAAGRRPAQQVEMHMGARDIAVLVGSLRKGSFNRMMAHALIELAPESLKLEIGRASCRERV